MKTFPPDRNYMLLSLKDLLEARDHYHVHLSHLSNVVGTAVGKYLIRKNDWYANNTPSSVRKTPPLTTPRTLFNTVVRDWSWPCVLVFVNKWEPKRAFAKDPDLMVPRALFLPDGRVVPTCTVLVEPDVDPILPDYHFSLPNSFIGGGYVTLANVQGREHVGSLACLVTDGDLTYALTNRHVTGAAGREMLTLFSGKRARIGISDPNQINTRPFTKMYDGWAGSNVQLHLDAGLIQIDDLADWTAQVASIGPLAEFLDLTTDSLTLDLIGEYARAFGAASGELRGSILALFYRYSTTGGTDYVADFLIAPRSIDGNGTLHGDSGTLWFWEQWNRDDRTNPQLTLRPFAMQWGGQAWIESGQSKRTGRFALATALSGICRELGVSVLRDFNSELPEYWAAVGHYTIGYFACENLPANIGILMKANQDRVSYPLNSITSPTKITKRGPSGFVPLADVPDRIWAHGEMVRGSADKPNHFADMDQEDPKNSNKTLLQLCQNTANITPTFWLQYYANVGDNGRGLLPFRVWQFFDEMVDALSQRKPDLTRFIGAAGICSHYVGDACQPLHISHLHDGEPEKDGKPGRGKGVHTAYEDKMLRQHSVQLLALIDKKLKQAAKLKAPTNGQQAANLTVALMQRTFKAIKPQEIVDAFADGKDLWDEFGEATVKVMTDGVLTMRAIWLGAWNKGGGKRIPKNRLVPADFTDLKSLYMKKTWMPSKNLKTIAAILK
jgi:hypothetical protein